MKPSSGRPAKRKRLVSRLLGMETEYATLVLNRPELVSADLPASGVIYARICAAIRRELPTVPGIHDQSQMFLASGAAVTFESHPSLHALPGGLVEIATPEVASPDELLACQRSIDDLVADAATECCEDIDLRVLKNSSDALGHVYGCQENYDAEVASGIWLLVYRGFVCLLWMMQVISLLSALPLLVIAGAMIMAIRIRLASNAKKVDKASSQVPPPNSQSASDLFDLLPRWAQATLMRALRWVHLPTVIVLRFVARHVAFRQQRRHLTAMLVSRVALCGAGDLDHDGRYRLSPKAMAIDVVADMGSYNGERPIYVYGHWLSQYCAKSFLSLGSTRQMFARRQRLQIGLSDSNLSELAEYVKIGSVSLVLDMIESGQAFDSVILRSPIESLHEIASDWNLVRRVTTNRGQWSALDIQHHYLKAARQFVQSIPAEERGESELVIGRWSELLDVVGAFRRDARNVAPGLGRVDWLSKRWMMDQLGKNAEWAERKKIDLRYHELSPDGYFRKLAAINPALCLIGQDRIEKRRRTPPAHSPAAKRGWLIREFGDGDDAVSAEWRYAVLGEGKESKRINFDT
ncbi:MAG: proteasome accessory factor PafA2 family protein [Planctomycetales bacterium]|nr:proteasome accessory factor PafA2 family protein [Planctomycetales bacterium]